MTRAVVILFLALTLSGCVGRMPVLQKRSYDFKSTALFRQPCDEDVPLGEYEIALNRCNSTRLLRMIDTFLTIQEADRTQGIPGDTLVDVRQKGFTIYIDEDKKIRRPNTRVLHGNEALAAVGMAVSPPPLQKPEEIRAYADFMAQHYAEESATGRSLNFGGGVGATRPDRVSGPARCSGDLRSAPRARPAPSRGRTRESRP